jgi:hypothetical protein
MSYTQLTLTALLAQLATKYEGVAYWTAEEGRLGINEALRVWSMFTGVWKTRLEVFTPQPSSPWIQVPTPLTYNVRMQWAGSNSSKVIRIDEFAKVADGVISAADRTRFSCFGFSIPAGIFGGVPMSRSSVGDLDNGRPGWEGETTTSGGSVPVAPSSFAPAGLDLFAIWPQDLLGGNTIVVDGVVQAPQLSLLTDHIDINLASIQPILGYALHYLAFKEGGRRWVVTQGYYKEFLLAAMDQNDRLATSALFRKAAGLDVNRGQRPLRVGLADQQRQQG